MERRKDGILPTGRLAPRNGWSVFSLGPGAWRQVKSRLGSPRCKHTLTGRDEPFSVGVMESSESFWKAWERIRDSSDPDPLEVLRIAAAFNGYFQAAQKEAISFARAAGLSWEQIAESLGQSRQSVWQRASRDPSLQALLKAKAKRRWEAIQRDPISWYENTKTFPV
jgi:hypothetical protein